MAAYNSGFWGSEPPLSSEIINPLIKYNRLEKPFLWLIAIADWLLQYNVKYAISSCTQTQTPLSQKSRSAPVQTGHHANCANRAATYSKAAKNAWYAWSQVTKPYQTLPMYNVRFSKQIFLALPSNFMVQDPSSLSREQTISTASGQWVTRKIKYVHLKHRPVWRSISAHIDHLVATLHHLPKGFL